MQESKNSERMKTGVFLSEDTREYYVAGMRKTYNTDSYTDKGDPMRHKKQRPAFSKGALSLTRNAAICAFAVLLVWGIASSTSDSSSVRSVREVVAYEYDEEDIGELKFVSSVIDDVAIAEEKNGGGEETPFVYPVDGIVTTTFAQNGSGAIITALDTRDCVASCDGEIYEVAENYIKLLNKDGSITTYFGVKSSKSVGENVCAGNIIGELLSDVLYVEKDINGEKTDPFA